MQKRRFFFRSTNLPPGTHINPNKAGRNLPPIPQQQQPLPGTYGRKSFLFPFIEEKVWAAFSTICRRDEQIYFQPHTTHKLITRDPDHEL